MAHGRKRHTKNHAPKLLRSSVSDGNYDHVIGNLLRIVMGDENGEITNDVDIPRRYKSKRKNKNNIEINTGEKIIISHPSTASTKGKHNELDPNSFAHKDEWGYNNGFIQEDLPFGSEEDFIDQYSPSPQALSIDDLATYYERRYGIPLGNRNRTSFGHTNTSRYYSSYYPNTTLNKFSRSRGGNYKIRKAREEHNAAIIEKRKESKDMPRVLRVSQKPDLYILPKVYNMMQELVIQAKNNEIAWHGFVRRIEDPDLMIFELYDIIVYPQTVSGASVTPDADEYAKWFEEKVLSRDDAINCRFHGHSHVNFACAPSSTDNQFRNDTLANFNMGKDATADDYYIFMIMNQKNEFSIELYDPISNTVFFGDQKTSDITITIDSYEEVWEAIEWADKQIKINLKNIETSTTSTATAGAKASKIVNEAVEWAEKYGGRKDLGYGPGQIFLGAKGYRKESEWYAFTPEEQKKRNLDPKDFEKKFKAAFYKKYNEEHPEAAFNHSIEPTKDKTKLPRVEKNYGGTDLGTICFTSDYGYRCEGKWTGYTDAEKEERALDPEKFDAATAHSFFTYYINRELGKKTNSAAADKTAEKAADKTAEVQSDTQSATLIKNGGNNTCQEPTKQTAELVTPSTVSSQQKQETASSNSGMTPLQQHMAALETD